MTRDWAGLKVHIKHVEYTGTPLGMGQFGSVEIVKMNGKEYAAKMYRMDYNEKQKLHIIKKYQTEYDILSKLKHKNIVRYVGVTFKEGHNTPLLIMEKLKFVLHDYLLETPVSELLLTQKLKFLYDVANGLYFLHTRNPTVIHRDLTAKNVLIDSTLTAKISDFGNSRIVDLEFSQGTTMTGAPGTLEYSAPETLCSHACYSSSIDMFSYGHLAMFTICQVFPNELLKATYKKGSKRRARSEVQRRKVYIKMLYDNLGREHKIVQLIKECLDDEPSPRPTAHQTRKILKELLSHH